MNAAKMLKLAQERDLAIVVDTIASQVGPVEVVTIEEDLCTFRVVGSRKMKALMFDEIDRIQVSMEPR